MTSNNGKLLSQSLALIAAASLPKGQTGFALGEG
jgi:hypothetical protein